MKEYFLVRKSIDDLRKDGEWQDVSLDAVREAAKIDVDKVDLFLTREDAEASALDGADYENDTDFFPVIRVQVPNHLKGRATEVELEDGTILKTRTFNAKDVKVTDLYLSHIDAGYDDVHLANAKNQAVAKTSTPSISKKEAEVVAKPAAPALRFAATLSRLNTLRQYLPSPTLTNAKHALGLTSIGLAYYFGNAQVADLVATTGYALPAAVASNIALPVGVGVAVRTVAEAPELLLKGGAKVVSGIGQLCKAGKAKWDARKAPKPAATKLASANAGSAQISQLAAKLDQPKDESSVDLKLSTSKVQLAAFDKQTEGREALRALIPQKSTVTAAEQTKLTVH